VLAKDCFSKAVKFEIDRGYELNPSMIYFERCEMLISNSPKRWDGVWNLETK